MIDCSIIIPHHNQIAHLSRCLHHIKQQEAEDINYEIIVVDNGSEEKLPFKENDILSIVYELDPKNPYICRNRGVSEAKGDILCFLDSKCRPDPKWLISGYRYLMDSNTHIAGGQFCIASINTLKARIFPLMYLDNEKNVKYGYGLPTGNLFVRKDVFETLGLFDTQSRSGNDIAWTRKAMKAGFKLGYAEESKVIYAGKSYNQLLNDIFKYGKGAYLSGEKRWYSALTFLMPMKPNTFLENSRNFDWGILEKFGAWLLVWRAKIQFAMGMISAILYHAKGKALNSS